MKANQHQSLRSGAPSQAGDLVDTASEREKAEAAGTSDRVAEAAPQRSDADDESGNPPGLDRSIDRGMASPGAASQAEASARHAAEKLPERERRPKS